MGFRMINSYGFGSIIVDERKYTSDIIIYPDGAVRDSWWRKEGHRLSAADINDLIESRPEIIIAGTGAYGLMQPEEGLNIQLRKKGIQFRMAPSEQAVKLYNDLYKQMRVGACFHLTC